MLINDVEANVNGDSRVANKEGTCGTATIEYDERCTWVCACFPGKPCQWSVHCPGDIKTTGTGIEVHPPDEDDPGPKHIGFDGPADAFAMYIGEQTGRRIEVPERLADHRITIEVEGGWDAALRAAGFAGEDMRLPRGISVTDGKATIDSSLPAAVVPAPDGGSVVVVLTASAARGTSGWGLGLVVRCDCKGIQGWCDTTLIDIGGGNREVQCVSHGCTLTCEQSSKPSGANLWTRIGWTPLSAQTDVGPVDQ